MQIEKILEEFKKNPNGLYERAIIRSVWDLEHWRLGELVERSRDTNTVTAEGINQLLRIGFTDGTPIALANWYVLLFKDDVTPADGTTYGTPVFTEETDYDSATRPLWQGGSVSGKSVDNSANKATYVFDATSDGNTEYGGALVGGVGASVKGDTADTDGRLYSAAKFGTAKPVEDNDTLKVTITLTGADV